MKTVIGVDEVGRGPLAGPVCVAAFSISHTSLIARAGLPLRDSKKLSLLQREKWFTTIKLWHKQGKCTFATSYVHATTIDRIGIAPAIKRALKNSLKKINAQPTHTILLDGGLKAPLHFKKQKTIIRGDERETVIALASIVAKVRRDRYMQKLAKKMPEYGFETHVGYGTRAHYRALRKNGLSPVHRRSFLKKLKSSKLSLIK
jgi:ribonuclease HII